MQRNPEESSTDHNREIIYSTPAFPSEEGLTFIGDSELIDVSDHADTVWNILSLSTGRLRRDEIIQHVQELSNESAELIDAIVSDLENLDILQPGTEQYKKFHHQTNNPQSYSPNLSNQELEEYTYSDSFIEIEGDKRPLAQATTNIASLAEQRKSVRGFESTPLSLRQIGEMLNGAYSSDMGVVPSAGGLYPIRLNMIASTSSEEYQPGYYQYNHYDETVVLYNDTVDHRRLEYALNEESNVFNAPVLFVISADIDRQPGKYSNRGYRFTMLEAGHVAQNMHLVAQELGLSTLEYGGFQDQSLATELQLDEQKIKPFIIIAAGYEAGNVPYKTSAEQLTELEEQLVGQDKPVEWCTLLPRSGSSENAGLIRAAAQYTSINRGKDSERSKDYAGGVDRSAEKAKIKAISEAYERCISGHVCIDRTSPAIELDKKWINPAEFTPLTNEQLEYYPQLHPFSPYETWEWVEGFNSKMNENVFAPIDLVYYPVHEEWVNRKLCTYANSSGVAAHKTEELAVENAMLELIERDAIMRDWFSKNASPKLAYESLDRHWQLKIEYWQSQGYEIDILDLSRNGVAVTNVMIRNKYDKFPCFMSGSSASIEGYDASIEKAFMEAETGLLAVFENPPKKPESMAQVSSPRDHGALYLYPEHRHQIEWLWQGDVIDQPQLQPVTLHHLIQTYNPTLFRLNNKSSPLSVVRIMSPQLIPINFGYMGDYYTHEEAQKILSSQYNPEIPHYFA